MRPATVLRVAGLNRLKACSSNGVARRYLTMLQPPKFENEKMVSYRLHVPRSLLTASKLNYAKGSPERAELTKTIQKLKSEFPFTIPIQINGSEVQHEIHHQPILANLWSNRSKQNNHAPN
jgi:1-pyrroline-5-carboxylate dehydrogenase